VTVVPRSKTHPAGAQVLARVDGDQGVESSSTLVVTP
jgi:hypothetical protein